MLKIILSIIGVGALTIVAISLFLRVDSLNRCGLYPSEISGCERADIIIAVSGGDTSGRAQAAIDLYKRGWGNHIVFSGAALDPESPSNAEVMRQQALRQDVKEDDIIIESQSTNTSQNAQLTADKLEELDVDTAILVTSGYHQKRTLMEFDRSAPEVDFRTQPSSSDRQWSVWWWTTPYGWYLAVSEITKILVISFESWS